MDHHSELSEVFRPHLQWHRARLDFLAAFVLALIRVREADPQQAPARYAGRWEIETLFKAFKSQGFDFESTHLTRVERMESLIALMSIALVWAHQVGEWLSQTKPIPIKTHARKLYSTFRYGLDYLRQLIFAAEVRKDELYACMRLLSCT